MLKFPKHPVIQIPFSAALALGVYGALCPAVLFGVWTACAVALGLALAAYRLLERNFAMVVVAGVLLGFGSWEIHTQLQMRSGFYERQLPDRSCGAEVSLRIVDPRLSTVPGIESPSLIRAEVRSLQLTGEQSARPASGITYLRPPSEGPTALRCGDVVTARGVFALPRSASSFSRDADGSLEELPPLRDFSSYLAGRGASRVFRAHALEIAGYEPGVLGRLAAFRDRLFERAVRHIDSAHNRNLAAALFFGTSGGVSAGTRSQLIESGTIHLFSVSGMHVAMLAAVLLLLLRPLPMRIRYPVLAALILLYVLSTGANAPAMRAFYMIALWCVLRSGLLYLPPFDALLLAGTVLALISPALLLDIGFQYSFLITAILILMSERFREATELLGEEFRFMPNSRFKRRRERALRRVWAILFAVAACVAAFFGGLGISVYSQGLLLPGSILANLLLLPVTGLLFPVLVCKLAFGALWSTFDRWGAALLDGCFRFMDAVTGFAAAGFDRMSALHPALWEVWIFYAALLLAIVARRRVALAALLVMLLLPLSWMLRAAFDRPALFVAYGGGTEHPVVALVEPSQDYVLVVDADGFDTVPAVADFLLRRGAPRVETLMLTAARTGNISGLEMLSSRLRVESAFVPELDRYSKPFRARFQETLPECPLSTDETADGYGPSRIIPQKNGFELVYFNPGSTFEMRLSIIMTDSGCDVTLRRPGAAPERRTLTYSSVPEVWEHEFR